MRADTPAQLPTSSVWSIPHLDICHSLRCAEGAVPLFACLRIPRFVLFALVGLGYGTRARYTENPVPRAFSLDGWRLAIDKTIRRVTGRDLASTTARDSNTQGKILLHTMWTRGLQRLPWQLACVLFAAVASADIVASNENTTMNYDGKIFLQDNNGNNLTQVVPLSQEAAVRNVSLRQS